MALSDNLPATAVQQAAQLNKLSTMAELLASTAPSPIVGTVASNVEDDGSAPIKFGGVATEQSPTAQEGQRVGTHHDLRHHAGLVLYGPNSNSGASVGLSGRATSASSNRLAARSVGERWNGSTYDRDGKPNQTTRIASSAGTVNAMLARAGSCDGVRVTGFSARASLCWLKLYDKGTAPVVGTDTPVLVLPVPPGAFSFPLEYRYFAVGLGFAITTGVSDNDAGAIAAGDVLGLNLTYAA